VEIWVTGIGAITAVGRDTGSLLDALKRGVSGVRPLPELDGTPAASAPPEMGNGSDRRADPTAALFRQAATHGWEAAGLDAAGLDPDRIGVCEGSSAGPTGELLRRFGHPDAGRPVRVRPSAVIELMPGAGGAAFARQVGARGPVLHVNAGSAAGAVAIGEAALWVAAGRVDVAVAGASESPLQKDIVAHFRAAGILSEEPGDVAPCRPFDPERRGTVLGEGAAALVLERAERARARGVEPLAVLRGYGLAAEEYDRVAPDPRGCAVARAVRQALAGAEAGPVCVKAHGSGTRLGDAAELAGLQALLGTDLDRTLVTGLKPVVGHCLGASGAVEAALLILALREGFVPATLGTRRLDPALPPCDLVTEVRAAPHGDALLLSEGFGGRSAALRFGPRNGK